MTQYPWSSSQAQKGWWRPGVKPPMILQKWAGPRVRVGFGADSRGRYCRGITLVARLKKPVYQADLGILFAQRWGLISQSSPPRKIPSQANSHCVISFIRMAPRGWNAGAMRTQLGPIRFTPSFATETHAKQSPLQLNFKKVPNALGHTLLVRCHSAIY